MVIRFLNFDMFDGVAEIELKDGLAILTGHNESGKSRILKKINEILNADRTKFTEDDSEETIHLKDRFLSTIYSRNSIKFNLYSILKQFPLFIDLASQMESLNIQSESIIDKLSYLQKKKVDNSKKIVDFFSEKNETLISEFPISFINTEKGNFIKIDDFSYFFEENGAVIENKFNFNVPQSYEWDLKIKYSLDLVGNKALLINNFSKTEIQKITFDSNLKVTPAQKKLLKIMKISPEEIGEYWNSDDEERIEREFTIKDKLTVFNEKFNSFYENLSFQKNKNQFVLSIEENRPIINIRDPHFKNSATKNIDQYKSSGFIEFIYLFILVSEGLESRSATIFLFDEPGNFLHPPLRFRVLELFQEMAKKGLNILITTHNLEMCNRDEYYFLSKGDSNKTKLQLNYSTSDWRFEAIDKILRKKYEMGKKEKKYEHYLFVEGISDSKIINKMFQKEIEEQKIAVHFSSGKYNMLSMIGFFLSKAKKITCFIDNDNLNDPVFDTLLKIDSNLINIKRFKNEGEDIENFLSNNSTFKSDVIKTEFNELFKTIKSGGALNKMAIAELFEREYGANWTIESKAISDFKKLLNID